ncbi:MAG TPA: tetratricopeptide repeat protein [Candidatus Paceibacterota bacterium]|nr:tetratricopeptide repeat protein [Candidatus Paceibacterota bacterium]
MTTEAESARPEGVVLSRLPWLLACGMLGVYLLTLNHGVSWGNLRQVAELSGWNWRPNVFAPVTFLVTYPLRWLPASVIAPVANLLAALCAALTLAQLARSVMRLPERSRFSLLAVRGAWLPPVLAVLVCGLQLTFWENSVQAAGEMLDLLLFACAVRCLLEFRLDRRQAWLNRFAAVYGLALANNWAMAGFLPFFVLAFLWTEPLSLFNVRFLKRVERIGWEIVAPALKADVRLVLRLALIGLGAMSLLLLLPLIASLSHTSHLDFWSGLRQVWHSYKFLLLRFPRNVVLLLSLTSVLPILFMGITRWGKLLRASSRGWVRLATHSVLHLIHGSFLIAAIWVALDCPVSPRHRGLGFAFLPFYYLGALSVGYFSGYFLLVFGTRIPQTRKRRRITQLVDWLVPACVWCLLVAVPGLLLYRNLPRIWAGNRDPMQGYCALIEQSLSPRASVILSDDPLRLSYFRAAMTRAGKPSPHLLLDATSLGDPAYLELLDRQHPQFKLGGAVSNRFSECATVLGRIRLMETLSRGHDLYYLHPSFGYFLEAFYAQAQGLVYQLKPYGTNVSDAPLPSREAIARNQAFWDAAIAEQLPPVLRALRPKKPPSNWNPVQRFLTLARLKAEPDRRAQIVGAGYSRALNYWGAELQECGARQAAANCFSLARELNPDNVAAQVNQEFNQALQAGQSPALQPAKAVADKFGRRREWDQVLQEDGPFAEPNFCYQVGVALARNGLYRQAIRQFNRVQALAPDLTDARHWLARLFIHTGNYSNALATANQLLQTRPEDDNALFLKAVSLLQSKAYDDAVGPFTHLLTAQTNNYAAQLNRAIAYLQLGKLDAARRDYEAVAQALPRSYQAWFGLGEIAYRQQDAPAAIRNYRMYLTNAPPDTEEAKLVSARLKELQLDGR